MSGSLGRNGAGAATDGLSCARPGNMAKAADYPVKPVMLAFNLVEFSASREVLE